jgi:pimeloyl-ACP methyl ester carboxylesterase
VPVPFNLAIFDTGAAQAVIDDHPEIESWAVGGHSLGGVAATMFIDGHEGLVDGLVLWAAYASGDLADDGLLVSLAYGTLDAGVPSFTDPANVAKLGPAVETTAIEGGNHEQMGWYTGRTNDPPATISRQEQQDAIVAGAVQVLAALEQPRVE